MAKRVKKSGGAADAGRGSEIVMTRLPQGMKEKVATLAESNGRSMNSEIIAAIEQHLKGPTAFDVLKNEVSRHDMTLAYTDHRLENIEAFIEKHRKNIEDIATIENTVQSLGGYAEGVSEGLRGNLRELLKGELRSIEEAWREAWFRSDAQKNPDEE